MPASPTIHLVGSEDLTGPYLELAARLQAPPGIPRPKLIAVTGYGQSQDRQKARIAGFAQHLVMPVDFDRLETAVNELTGR